MSENSNSQSQVYVCHKTMIQNKYLGWSLKLNITQNTFFLNKELFFFTNEVDFQFTGIVCKCSNLIFIGCVELKYYFALNI